MNLYRKHSPAQILFCVIAYGAAAFLPLFAFVAVFLGRAGASAAIALGMAGFMASLVAVFVGAWVIVEMKGAR